MLQDQQDTLFIHPWWTKCNSLHGSKLPWKEETYNSLHYSNNSNTNSLNTNERRDIFCYFPGLRVHSFPKGIISFKSGCVRIEIYSYCKILGFSLSVSAYKYLYRVDYSVGLQPRMQWNCINFCKETNNGPGKRHVFLFC